MELNWLARRGARSIDARLRRFPFQFMLRGSALGRISFVSGGILRNRFHGDPRLMQQQVSRHQ
jgi:hypothetical protein